MRRTSVERVLIHLVLIEVEPLMKECHLFIVEATQWQDPNYGILPWAAIAHVFPIGSLGLSEPPDFKGADVL